MTLRAPFPYFGGKGSYAAAVWRRFGNVHQYIEPFCGSAAILLGAPRVAPIEIINDASGFIINFWKAIQSDPQAVAKWADYPISHLDLGLRHLWLVEQRQALAANLADPHWPGDTQIAGWWLWGQCAWIGSGWCNEGKPPTARATCNSESIAASGQIPVVNGEAGIHGRGKIPQIDISGSEADSANAFPTLWTSSGRNAAQWLVALATRLDRVKILHGDWQRCLKYHCKNNPATTAVFLDPPYVDLEYLYDGDAMPIAKAVELWAAEHAHIKIALCGVRGDYDLPDWQTLEWNSVGILPIKRVPRVEVIHFSPACIRTDMPNLFEDLGAEALSCP